jgi:hypothetical protein
VVDKNKKDMTQWLKYSGLAFQMFFLLLAGWFVGAIIDDQFSLSKPVFALLFMVIFLIGFFYKLIKDLSNSDK